MINRKRLLTLSPHGMKWSKTTGLKRLRPEAKHKGRSTVWSKTFPPPKYFCSVERCEEEPLRRRAGRDVSRGAEGRERNRRGWRKTMRLFACCRYTCRHARAERADDRWITSSYDLFFSKRLQRVLCRKKVQTSIKENNLRKLKVNICLEQQTQKNC